MTPRLTDGNRDRGRLIKGRKENRWKSILIGGTEGETWSTEDNVHHKQNKDDENTRLSKSWLAVPTKMVKELATISVYN